MSKSNTKVPVAQVLDVDVRFDPLELTRLAFGLPNGDIVAVNLEPHDVSEMVIELIATHGHPDGPVEGKLTLDAIRKGIERNRIWSIGPPPPEAPAKKERKPKPFARSTGRHLRVAFPGEGGHRQLAIVAGWTVSNAKDRTDEHDALLLRWKVVEKGKRRYRDFVVRLPDDHRSGKVEASGAVIDEVTIDNSALLSLDKPAGHPVRINDTYLTRWSTRDLLNRIQRRVFHADRSALAWAESYVR